MKKILCLAILAFSMEVTVAQTNNIQKERPKCKDSDAGFEYEADRFADIRILRYRIPCFDQLTVKQKTFVYYLTQAGLAGRDIMWAQNGQYNLPIRNVCESIYTRFQGDKSSKDWLAFETYLKQLWMSNGIHHHYSNIKHQPQFSLDYFNELLGKCQIKCDDVLIKVMFDPDRDLRKVEKDASKGLIENSAVNFYGDGITTKEAIAFYESKMKPENRTPLSYGINADLIKVNGQLQEDVYRIGGKYGAALEQVVYWLEKAESVAENDKQAVALRKLILFYKTGDLKAWDDFNIQWARATEGDIDFIHGFVEVYNDPLGNRGSFEAIVEINDFEASERMKTMMDHAQWFEDNSPTDKAFKKEKVVGITYKVVNVAGEAGDANPSTPIGVNLPNAQWIRTMHGSKSVSLGNIEDANNKAGGSGILREFAYDDEEIDRAIKFGEAAGKMHTAMHEVIGHASGKLKEGVPPSSQSLKEYASTIEEGRADLVALYFVMDPKLVEWGLMPSLEVGKAEYDGYFRNGLLVQLRRLKLGEEIEEAHMRNRAWICGWIMEQAAQESEPCVFTEVRDGKTYVKIRNYEQVRNHVGLLLQEVQRITSEGDYDAARDLADRYGKRVDPAIHEEILTRSEKLNIPPYNGFMNPVLKPITDDKGNIKDVQVTYMDSFA
ncbi:MAG: hypothetical protein RLY35_521, partial [Bacteroidota bacterium]